MALVTNNNGCCCGSTRVGALNSLCRPCNYPYYTGPCPPAPCNGCGCSSSSSQTSTNDLAAAIARAMTCSTSSTSSSNNTSCSSCPTNCNPCSCNPCNCNPCPTNCGQNSALCTVCPSLCQSNTGSSCSVCGPCASNGCQMCYGVFTANGTINITAGATIPLEARNMNSNCFSVSNGVITVLEPGLYLAILSVDTPSNAAVDTTIQLQVDGQVLVPPRLVIDTVANNTINNYTGSGVFCARAGSSIQVTTSAALNVTGTAGQPVVSLTLIRLQ